MHRLLILADDLTGAGDAAAPFAALWDTEIHLRSVLSPMPASRVISISTDTRNAPVEDVRRLVQTALSPYARQQRWAHYIKIDSTLKGSPGAHLTAAVEAIGARGAVVCPANPEQGRVVSNGVLSVLGSSTEIDVGPRLREHTRLPVAPLAGARSHSELDEGLWVADAESANELARLAHRFFDADSGMVLAGSGGLCRQLVNLMIPDPGRLPAVHEPNSGDTPTPFLIVIGSNNPISVAQTRTMLERHDGVVLDELSTQARAESLASGRPCVLHVGRDHAARTSLTPLVRSLSDLPRGVALVTGGDTSSEFCRVAGVDRFKVVADFRNGCPLLSTDREPLRGWRIVIKPGGFGQADTVSRLYESMIATGSDDLSHPMF